MYKISEHTKKAAKKLGVKVRPSEVTTKKIDVIKDDHVIASVGAKGMGDYPTYLRTHGKEYADERRRLYKARHEKHRHDVGTPSYYADKLLW